MAKENEEMIIIPVGLNHGKCITYDDLQEAGFYNTLSDIDEHMRDCLKRADEIKDAIEMAEKERYFSVSDRNKDYTGLELKFEKLRNELASFHDFIMQFGDNEVWNSVVRNFPDENKDEK